MLHALMTLTRLMPHPLLWLAWLVLVLMPFSTGQLSFLEANAAETDVLDKAHSKYYEGDFARAESLYSKVITEQPGNIQAGLGLARALSHQGKNTQAKGVLQQLMTQQPPVLMAFYVMGEVLESEGNMAGAKQYYQQFVQQSGNRLPPDPSLRLKLRQLGLY